RQRPLGPPTVARAPHSHDRAQPPQPPESDPGPSRVAPLLSSLENRTPFRLAAQLPSARNSLGVLRSQLPRDAPTRLPHHPPEEFMRCVLVRRPALLDHVASGVERYAKRKRSRAASELEKAQVADLDDVQAACFSRLRRNRPWIRALHISKDREARKPKIRLNPGKLARGLEVAVG